MRTDGNYDYIVAGAGAAGCVIARRLLERAGGRILLLEAGGTDDRETVRATDVPTVTSMWGDENACRQYRTVPQAGCDSREIVIAQGAMVGGGTSVNALIHVRGNRRDFDHWNHLGNEGWSYADLLPYFKAAENYPGGDPAYRGTGGPLEVTGLTAPSAASAAFVQAARQLGFAPGGSSPAPGDFDYNAARQENGAFFYQSTRTAAGQRCSAATAYLRPVLGDPRLTLRSGTTVTRVLLRRGRATGVEYLQDGTVRTAGTDGEVIVCCGAFGSPQLLLLSGIGPADELRALGIAPAANLPGVGRNLQDHLLLGVGWECLREQPAPQLLAEAGLFVRSRAGLSTASPDLQFFFGPVQFFADQYRTPGPGFTFAPILTQPRSRGTVTLRSADPRDMPVIDPHYLEAAADMDTLLAGIAMARELAHTRAFDPLRGRELAPGAGVRDRARLAAYVRQSASTVWHPAGTCRMGHDADAVVDPALRLHGVEGLRVADSSVMPTVTAGNTEAPVVAIAEQAAALIAAASSEPSRAARRQPLARR